MAGKVEVIPDEVEDALPIIEEVLSEYGLELTEGHYSNEFISRRVKKRHFWESGWEDLAKIYGSHGLVTHSVDKSQLDLIKAVAEKIASKTNLNVRICL